MNARSRKLFSSTNGDRAKVELGLEVLHIVEHGRHDELLTLDGRYARLWHTQQQARGWRLGQRTATGSAGSPPADG